MHLCSGKFEDINKNLKNDSKIYCFGCGLHFGDFIRALDAHIDIHNKLIPIDNNKAMWGKELTPVQEKLNILSPNEMLQKINSKDILLITCADTSSIIEQLNKIEQLNEINCYVSAAILSLEFEESNCDVHIINNNVQKIAKRINYCWFGDNAIPTQFLKYIDTWKKFCPDYEIILWNEKNYDVSKNPYMLQAYEMKKWGFVPDYARLDIIYNYGGIYLDTDVEVIRSLDDLLYQDGFCGIHANKLINLGMGFGAKPRLDIIKEMRDFYINFDFKLSNGEYKKEICSYYHYHALKGKGYVAKDKMQTIGGLNIYPSEVFTGYNPLTDKYKITKNTFTIHHSGGSCLSEKEKENVKKRSILMEEYLNFKK